jgi:prophage regulatory protein
VARTKNHHQRHTGVAPRGRNILRKPAVRIRTGLSDSQIWRLEKVDEFPARILIGATAVGWFEDEVDHWIATRPRAYGKQPPLPKSRRPAEEGEDEDEKAA